jgi:nucleoside-diphosphate-sugar epimerase
VISEISINHPKQITLFGCGWLGYPLAQELIQHGYTVCGTTTSENKMASLKQAGIEAFLLDVSREVLIPERLFQTDVWIMAFPPKTKSTDGGWYGKAVANLVQKAGNSAVQKIILLSSTSVYPDSEVWVTEEDLITEVTTGNTAIFKAEEALLASHLSTYVLRLGGLAGDDRVLARHFAGKSQIPKGHSPVNLLHRQDAIQIIQLFVENEYPNGIYNVCSPEHPSRLELYTQECAKRGWPAPVFVKEGKGKMVSVDKLCKETGYHFLYPHPADFV